MKLSSRFFDVYMNFAGKEPGGQKQIAVGTGVYKKAVDRNKLKRRIREIIRKVVLPPNRSIRIIAKKDAAGGKFKNIKEDLEQIFNKL